MEREDLFEMTIHWNIYIKSDFDFDLIKCFKNTYTHNCITTKYAYSMYSA